eukprot:CAMPEP_0178432042 /NCGR_PEP_ID=MMETSP0689_2-20121128/32174_1 /TAXON_ID=160604 /ORGANISM="Amphidinium massartii, Strain CS-259" /LENGTH=116 /DNA_ID=CAMNT_0020054003 /DNA_START=186 /DNA_END=536 /DNA_ORIENTATION=-
MAMWAMMLYLRIRPTRIEVYKTAGDMPDNLAKKTKGCKIIGIAATGTAATAPYVCIICSVHAHHRLSKVVGNVSLIKPVPCTSTKLHKTTTPATVPTALHTAVRSHIFSLANTAEQ